MALLNPAAPEASACSAAGIHWALEDLVASCLHHRQWHEVQARSKLAPSLFMPACLSALARPGRLLPACSSRPVQAVSCPPAPHEVGVCHRLWPVSFPDFVCLFGFARLLVSAPSRLQACSCLLHMKSVFVTGYGLCHFLTSCVFPRPWPRPPCDFPRPWPRPCPRAPASCPPVSVRARGRGRAPAPRTSAHAVRGPVSRPPLYPLYGQRHSMQDTQPETSVPSSAIWRSRM